MPPFKALCLGLLGTISSFACGRSASPTPSTTGGPGPGGANAPGQPHPAATPAYPPAPAVGATPAAPTLASHEQAILDRHNQHRAQHCAPPLLWSTELASVAQAWADELKKRGCAFQHSQQSRFGENLSFFAPVGSRSPDDIATDWYSEVSAYNFAKGAFEFSTGHFTQVVWLGTRTIGCGQSLCNGGEIWVCNYDPPGNMIGAFGQNVLPTSCTSQ